MRSESESELTGLGAGGTERESCLSGIVAKTTVQVSCSLPEQQQQRTKEAAVCKVKTMVASPFELAEKDRSACTVATMADLSLTGDDTGLDSTFESPKSPKEYELKALASLQEGRKSLSQA